MARKVTVVVTDSADAPLAGALVYNLDTNPVTSAPLSAGGPMFTGSQEIAGSPPVVTGADGKAVLWVFPTPDMQTTYIDYTSAQGAYFRTTIPHLAVTTDTVVTAIPAG